MKIIFNRQEICNAVTPLMCAVSGKSTLSAIEGILIDAAADGTCTLTTFDLEKGMRLSIHANVEEAGSYILNAQKFSQTMRVMEGESVTLTVTPNLQACIASGKSTHRMNALAGKDFPSLPPLETEDGLYRFAGGAAGNDIKMYVRHGHERPARGAQRLLFQGHDRQSAGGVVRQLQAGEMLGHGTD